MSQRETDTTDGIARPVSRRRILSLGGAGILSVLGGCSSNIGGSTSSPGQADESVFKEISFEGKNLVVGLNGNHEIDRLNLISPDGSQFAAKSIATGATRTEIQLLDIEWGLGGYEHYVPGEYEVVAVRSGEVRDNQTIELYPRVEIGAVSTRKNRDNAFIDTLELQITNRGTGPTWIYDIAYPEIEKGIVSTLGDSPGVPQSYLASPEEASEVIITPGESQRFVGRDTPFRFESNSVCDGETVRGKVSTGTPTDAVARRDFVVKFSGSTERSSASTDGEEYYCTQGSANVVGTSENET